MVKEVGNMNSKLLRVVKRYCPLCDKEHEVEERERLSSINIKGECVKYKEVYFECKETNEEENEFVSAKMMDENLLRSRDVYRKEHNMLTSLEIKQIRQKYGVTQAEFSYMLGLGEVTITRYETKLIQDTTYDTMMKLMDKNAMFALESLEANKEKFKNRERYEKIENNIKMIILKFTLSYLNDQEIEAKYVDYDTEKIENGYKNIDVQLIKDLIYYISKKCNNLYKVKLMKLLWYIDNLYYNQYGKAMTGLVYTHQKMGALPIGNEEIMKFNCIKVEEIINENSDDVLVGYHIKPNEDYEFKGLKKDQKKIVDEVLKKFENYTTKNIVEYMHEEKAYKDTKYNEIIDYSYSKFIKI